jgi:ADP-ribosylation factor-like protein 6
MGLFKRLFGGFTAKKKVRIVVVGLDNSGKTTVLNCLKPKKASLETVPTVGFSTQEFQKHGINFCAFDMSGQSRYRNLWEHYYGDVEGIVVVIDATDKLRFAVVKDELQTLLADPRVEEKKIPILFLSNKMDMPTASPPGETMMALELEAITDRPWHIAPVDALKGEGVEEAIHWLVDAMRVSDNS